MPDFRKFAVYRTVDVDLSEVVDVLGKGVFGDKKQHNMWTVIDEVLTTEPAKLIKQHRNQEKSKDLNQSLFVVVNRRNFQREGVLVVNLNFKGQVDAIRQETNVAGDDVPSMNIGNTTWVENLCNGEPLLFPRKRFALYVQERKRGKVTRSAASELEGLERSIQGGLDGRKSHTSQKGGICVLEKVEIGDSDLEAHHRKDAQEKGYDPEIFGVVDRHSPDAHNILLIGVGSPSGLRVDATVVGELLLWIYVGLISSDSDIFQDIAKRQGELFVSNGEGIS